MYDTVVYAERSCYNFYDVEFDTLVLFSNPNVKIPEDVQSRMADVVCRGVYRFLSCEPEDYENDLDTIITLEISSLFDDNELNYGHFTVYTTRLGRKDENNDNEN